MPVCKSISNTNATVALINQPVLPIPMVDFMSKFVAQISDFLWNVFECSRIDILTGPYQHDDTYLWNIYF